MTHSNIVYINPVLLWLPRKLYRFSRTQENYVRTCSKSHLSLISGRYHFFASTFFVFLAEEVIHINLSLGMWLQDYIDPSIYEKSTDSFPHFHLNLDTHTRRHRLSIRHLSWIKKSYGLVSLTYSNSFYCLYFIGFPTLCDSLPSLLSLIE